MKSLQNLASIALIGGGVAGFAVASKPLLKNDQIDVPLNILGINRSPYGEVFAMAMQESIDTYFHASTRSGARHTCSDPVNCQHPRHKESDSVSKSGNDAAVSDRLRSFIDAMGEGLVEPTNPKGATAGHKFFIRRGVEDKLRFAYNLDPSHYGNYNAYHFFLTEPELGTRPELTPTAAMLAEQTISYCLSKRDDPRAALTAAAASGNVIQLMLNDRQIHPNAPNFSVAQMRSILHVTDRALDLYASLSDEWAAKSLWQNLSPMRVAEISSRFKFILKVRESQDEAIRRLEALPVSGNQQLSTSKNADQHER